MHQYNSSCILKNIANEDLENFVIISRALQLQETEQYLKFVIALREGKNQKSPLIKPNGPTEGEVLALIQHLKEFEKVAGNIIYNHKSYCYKLQNLLRTSIMCPIVLMTSAKMCTKINFLPF